MTSPNSIEELAKRKNKRSTAKWATHGYSYSDTYKTWIRMKQRCSNKNNSRYKRYGGRGITVCKRWLNFSNFLADMGKRPDGLTLDRINNNGDYKPSNCRWADRRTQMSNRLGNIIIPFKGRTQCMEWWAKEIGMSPNALKNRLVSGYSIEEALTVPKHSRRNNIPIKSSLTQSPDIFSDLQPTKIHGDALLAITRLQARVKMLEDTSRTRLTQSRGGGTRKDV